MKIMTTMIAIYSNAAKISVHYMLPAQKLRSRKRYVIDMRFYA